ncbi:MAG: LON peptidase substrate-binding domain-containing protein, partial [Pseudomonadota bacterium]|nr:LON peptidase substrate-binding domain-containing protein [Pseudomonadota bacterium]
MTERLPTTHLPVLPLRDIVVFPHMIVPLFVGREKSVRALEAVMSENKQILLLTQTDAAIEDPGAEDMFTMGTVGNILQLLKLPDGTVKVLVEGVTRAQVTSLDEAGTYMTGQAVELEDIKSGDPELVALGKATVQQF